MLGSKRLNPATFVVTFGQQIVSIGVIAHTGSAPLTQMQATEIDIRTDEELVEIVVGGKVECFEELITRYQPRVFGMARTIAALGLRLFSNSDMVFPAAIDINTVSTVLSSA